MFIRIGNDIIKIQDISRITQSNFKENASVAVHFKLEGEPYYYEFLGMTLDKFIKKYGKHLPGLTK